MKNDNDYMMDGCTCTGAYKFHEADCNIWKFSEAEIIDRLNMMLKRLEEATRLLNEEIERYYKATAEAQQSEKELVNE